MLCDMIWNDMICYNRSSSAGYWTSLQPLPDSSETATPFETETTKCTVSRRQDSQNKGNDSYAPHVRRKTQRVKVHHFRSCKQQISYHQWVDATTLAVSTCQDSLFRTPTTWQERMTSGASLIVFPDLAENGTGMLRHIHQQTTF